MVVIILKCYQIQKFALTLRRQSKVFEANTRLFDVTGQGSLLVTDKTKTQINFSFQMRECVEI